MSDTPSTDVARAVTTAEAVADHGQLQVDIASSRAREEMLGALTRIRATVAVLGRCLLAYQDEHKTLLDEIDGLRDELSAERSWHADVERLAHEK